MTDASQAIARLRELRAKATAGRLLALPQKPNWDVYWHVTDGEDFVCQLYSEHVEFDNAKANAAAIVAAMNSLESLLACAEALVPFAEEHEYWKNEPPEKLMMSDGDGTLSPADIPWAAIQRARAALQALAGGKR
jgi:hypothetical protein